MSGSALTTSPFSYSQTCSTFRTVVGDSPATGGIPYVDHFKHNGPRYRFIFQLCFKHEPASVQNAFSHSGFDQFLTAHAACEYCRMAVYQRRAVLIQGIFAAVPDFGVNGAYTSFFVRPLPPCLLLIPDPDKNYLQPAFHLLTGWRRPSIPYQRPRQLCLWAGRFQPLRRY